MDAIHTHFVMLIGKLMISFLPTHPVFLSAFASKGIYFGQNFHFFFPSSNKNMPISPLFFLQTPVKISMVSLKWREAPKVFPFLTQNCTKKGPNGAQRRQIFTILHEIVQKKLKLTVEKKNREEIHQKQEKYSSITETLTAYHYFSPTEFLPCIFPS